MKGENVKKYNPEGLFLGKDGKENRPLGTGQDIYFKLAKNARNWQVAFLIMSVFCLILLVTNIRLSNRSQLFPYIIEIDKDSGIIKNIGDLRRIGYNPTDKNVFSTLNQHIIATRSIPLDPVRYGKDIQEQYFYLNEVTQQKMLEYILKDNVEKKMKAKESRDVSITSILKIRDKTYQIRWEEKNYSDTGNIYAIEKMTGIFTVDYIKPTSEKMILINPLGVIITDFSYSREM